MSGDKLASGASSATFATSNGKMTDKEWAEMFQKPKRKKNGNDNRGRTDSSFDDVAFGPCTESSTKG